MNFFRNSKKLKIFELLLLILLIVGCANDPTDEKQTNIPKPVLPAITVPIDESLYRQNGCESCHGSNGGGNPNGKGNDNLTDFRWRKTYKNGYSVFEISKSIKNGVPGTTMKSYAHLKEHEIISIAKYIRKMQLK